MRNPRALLAAGALVAVAVVAIGALLLSGSGGDNAAPGKERLRVTRATLTLEQAPRPGGGGRELLVSLPAEQLNRPELTGGAQVVWLRCVDASGAEVTRHPFNWPLAEEAGFLPHIHHPLGTSELRRIRGCRLTAPGIDFAAQVSGPPPEAEDVPPA